MPDLPTYNNLREEALNWRHVAEQFLNARDVTVNAMAAQDEKWKASHGTPDSVEDALNELQARWGERIEHLTAMARTAPGYSEGWAMGLLQALGEVIKVSRMFPKKG